MFYRKNVSGPERGVRLVAGLLLIACGAWGLGATPLGWLVVAAGAITILTGAVGFCPMCAMVGRKLPPTPPSSAPTKTPDQTP